MTDVVARFRALVAQRLGLQLGDAGHAPLVDVLARRIAATALDPEDYLDELAQARLDGELGAVAEAVTVAETYLFRGVEQLRALTEVVLPALARNRPAAQPIQILSAGCASGDEPYSIAIAVREAGLGPVAIRAVDANRAMLAQARRARFRTWALRETPAEIQRRYFQPAGRDFALDEAVRGAVTFEHRNLVDDDAALWLHAAYDVVFCRNVIMYFSPEIQRAVVERIAGALRPGGYLFVGHAESLRELSQRFELCQAHGAFYYQRRGGAGAPVVAQVTPVASPAVSIAAAAVAGTVPVAVVDGAGGWVEAIRAAADRIAALTASHAATPPAVAARAEDLAGVVELVRRERFGDALAVIGGLPAEAASDPDVLLLHAVLLAHGGRLAAAQDACRRLLAIAWCGPRGPRVAGAHYVLALCCEAVGDRRGAEDHGQTAAYLDPTFAMPRLHLGLAARRVGDHAAARRELGHALVLLHRESASRLLLFGGGFDRDALIALCRAELAACGAAR
ncbi:MAG TPA: CheR family methyltransferase [Kofleriaceae bacterium]|nr:CheR family methyltransferase [Kofleriaceae bacterium]